MTRALRQSLDQLKLTPTRAEHMGLAFHTLLPTHDKPQNQLEPHPYHKHADYVAGIAVPTVYPNALQRWQDAMTALGAVTFRAQTQGPLAVGLGNVSVSEVGLTLHHTYGVPYLPGSALKGLARRAAAAYGLSEKDPAFGALFGTSADSEEASAGYVKFWDGWLIVENEQKPLQRDVLTVHHKDYYGEAGAKYPTDFDDPNPVPFLSVRPGMTFKVAVTCTESRELAELAARLLDYGLSRLGLGGKTNAGYGKFSITERELSEAEKRSQAEAEARLQAEREEAERLAREQEAQATAIREAEALAAAAKNRVAQAKGRADKMTPANVKNEVTYFIGLAAELPSQERQQLLEHVRDKVQGSARLRDDRLLRRIAAALEEE